MPDRSPSEYIIERTNSMPDLETNNFLKQKSESSSFSI